MTLQGAVLLDRTPYQVVGLHLRVSAHGEHQGVRLLVSKLPHGLRVELCVLPVNEELVLDTCLEYIGLHQRPSMGPVCVFLVRRLRATIARKACILCRNALRFGANVELLCQVGRKLATSDDINTVPFTTLLSAQIAEL